MAELQLRDVKKQFGHVEVIRDVALDVRDGEFVVLVGPSGCGKSTLLRMISGLETVSSGEIFIGTDDVTDEDPSDRGVAMVFQSYALYPHMTVRQNIGFGLRMGGMPRAEVAGHVDEAARVLELTELLDRKPRALSGGQRQRVAIGRAIVRKPKVFLFDEPLSNLDAELRVQMRLEITKLHHRLGATMIYVTHDQVEAMTLADRIVVLRAGVVEQVGTPIELYDDPDNLFVAGFIGSPRMNFMQAEIAGRDGREASVKLTGFGDVALTVTTRGTASKVGDKVLAGVRPEHFIDAAEAPVKIASFAQVVEQLGGVSYVYAGEGDAQLTVQQKGHSTVPDGSAVEFGIDPTLCLLFDADGKRI